MRSTGHSALSLHDALPISGDAQRAYQSLLVYAPGGQRVARYDKMHLFRFMHDEEEYDESRTIRAGSSPQVLDVPLGDRKSTRLNSSRANISYAVFCLNKKI